MEKTQPAVDDRVLQFLAERHAEAEDVLDSMVEAVGGVPEDRHVRKAMWRAGTNRLKCAAARSTL